MDVISCMDYGRDFMVMIIDDVECREMADDISKTLADAQKHGVNLTKDFIWSMVYQELKRSPLNKTRT